MAILHLLPSRREGAAGLASAVQGLVAAQQELGLASSCLGSDELTWLQRGGPIVRHVLCQTDEAPAVIHSHGLWLAASAASRALRRRGLISVVAPHGMLDPWALRRRRTLKRLLWWAGERRTLQRASCLQALCLSELKAIRALGIRAPVALIPNGVALPERTPTALTALPPPPWLAAGVPAAAPVLLFLGRFHAKKGLDALLTAWQQLQARAAIGREQPWLVLAGFGDGGSLAEQLRRAPLPHICQVGALQGPAKASAYAYADGFVLPSFSEGLPMAALEAMSWGLPCLLSPACNLPEAYAVGAAWAAPPEAEPLVAVLQRWQQATEREPEALQAMGSAGRALVAARFSWSQVAAQTSALYSWLQAGGSPPAWLDRSS